MSSPSPLPPPQQLTKVDDSFLRKFSFIPSGISIAASFSFWDSNARISQYINPLARVAEQLRLRFEIGAIEHHWAISHDAFTLRNKFMELTRSRLTAPAFAMSEYLKVAPVPFEILRAKYSKQVTMDLRLYWANRLTMSPFSPAVTEAATSQLVLQASTRPNPDINQAAYRGRFFGLTAAFLFPGQLTFRLYRAPSEDRIYELFLASSEVVGGTLASWKLVPHLWAACKVNFPPIKGRQVTVVHLIFNLATSTVGSLTGATAFDTVSKYNKL
jgi:hypothetical protein